MNKFFKIADKIIFIFISNASAIMTFLIFFIITVMVIMRYVFRTSFGGLEELPTYLLMLAIWTGAVICSRDPKEGQIKIDLLETILKKKPKARASTTIVIQLFSISCMGLFGVLSWKYMAFCLSTSSKTLALGFPIWILVFIMFISVVFLVIYECVILYRAVNVLRGRAEL